MRAPVSSETTMYACSRLPSAAVRTASTLAQTRGQNPCSNPRAKPLLKPEGITLPLPVPICDNFLHGFKGAPSGRAGRTALAGPRLSRDALTGSALSAGRAAWRGDGNRRATVQRRGGGSTPLPTTGSPPVAGPPPPRRGPAPASPRLRPPADCQCRATRTGWGRPPVAGHPLTAKDHSSRARLRRVADAMALRATLDNDLSRKGLGAYQDGGQIYG